MTRKMALVLLAAADLAGATAHYDPRRWVGLDMSPAGYQRAVHFFSEEEFRDALLAAREILDKRRLDTFLALAAGLQMDGSGLGLGEFWVY